MRILVTLPWGQRLGGAEAMLQTVLDGAHESGHELELVFFEPGPWPAELRDAGFRVEVIPAGRLRQPHRWIATVVAARADLPPPPTRSDPQLGGQDAAVRRAGGHARGHGRPRPLVAAGDPDG